MSDDANEPGVSREVYRKQVLDSIGGWSGLVVTAIPPLVFVAANALTDLTGAIIAAIAAGLILMGYRLVRKQPLQQAVTGLVGVVIAAAIAAYTHQARGYFLLGIWTSFVYAGVFAASILVRRPLIGLAWEFLDPTPDLDGRHWHRVSPLLRAYVLATLAATVVFLARGVVQLALFAQDATGWLAVARIAMGYPLTLAALGYAYWAVRRARHHVT